MKNVKWIILGGVISVFIFGLLFFFNVISINQVKTNSVNTQENLYIDIAQSFDELKDDLDFYKYILHYAMLLEDDIYKKYDEVNAVIMDEENEELEELVLIVYMHELFKDETLKTEIENLKDKIYQEKNTLTESERTELFGKNTSCLQLTANITELLENKYDEFSYYSPSETETLDYIAYSPTLGSCIYVTDYTYYDDDDHYFSKKIYNATTNSRIHSYVTYYFNSSYLSVDEQNAQEKTDEREYIKYILENTNYNVELLGEVF